ncbi:MAG: leucine-rich repeat domain-containing protein [Spirochaetaceae bacterium]|nr:leucine-rich repeat domain-containing protein [Spirochaetaceae bacterium]
MESIGDNAFSDCSALERLQLSGSLLSIGSWAFGNCSSLRELAIPEGVELIDDYTFSGCSALEKLQLPGHFKQYDIQSRLDIPNRVEITYSDGL